MVTETGGFSIRSLLHTLAKRTTPVRYPPPLVARGVLTATLITALLIGSAAMRTASAQSCPPPPNPPPPVVVDSSPAPAANPADVATLDAIITEVYAVISGPAGQKRDWGRFRSLFLPGARLVPTRPCTTGGNSASVWTPAEYAARAGANLEKNGFFEREIARHADTYGDIAQVFTTYESRHLATDPQPFARGINSMQFFNDGTRWWVVTIFWDAEHKPTPDGPATNPIPPQYLPQTPR